MPKYEYIVLTDGDMKMLGEALRQAGQEGFRVVQIVEHLHFEYADTPRTAWALLERVIG